MLDDTEGVQTPVEDTTESVPQDEVPETTQTDELAPEGDDVPDELPEDEQKRKDAFIKMRQELKQLKSQVRAGDESQGMSVLDELRRGNKPHVDPITPDTDLNQVTTRMTMAERTALEAKQETVSLKGELENLRLYRAFPELDPEHPDHKKPETQLLDQYVAGQMLLLASQGKKYDAIAIARRAKDMFSTMTSTQKEQAADEAVKKLQKKELGSLEAKGNSVAVPRSQNVEDLRSRIRRGDEQALTDRMKMLLPDDI